MLHGPAINAITTQQLHSDRNVVPDGHMVGFEFASCIFSQHAVMTSEHGASPNSQHSFGCRKPLHNLQLLILEASQPNHDQSALKSNSSILQSLSRPRGCSP